MQYREFRRATGLSRGAYWLWRVGAFDLARRRRARLAHPVGMIMILGLYLLAPVWCWFLDQTLWSLWQDINDMWTWW